MLAITLGTPASGTTWVFNVVRALFAQVLPHAVSLSTAEASDLFDNVPGGSRDIIVKAHSLDAGLLTLASLFQAKVILTTRDPRDSLVSQRERFGATLHEAVRDLSRSSATISMLDDSVPCLRLRYEDHFTDKSATVAHIAQFLGFQIGTSTIDDIYRQFRPENVTRALDRLSSRGDLKTFGFDASSHWHPGHVGDGESGKWQHRLPPEDQEAVIGAVGSDLHDNAATRCVHWSAKLFTYHDGRSAAANEMLACEGDDRALLWGPYQHLPSGRWQVSPQIRLRDLDRTISIKTDVFIPVTGRDQLSLRVLNLPAASPERMIMEFDHHNHAEPVELRISSIADGRTANVEFAGADLTWLGPSERSSIMMARPVTPL